MRVILSTLVFSTICFISGSASASVIGEPFLLESEKQSQKIFEQYNETNDGLYESLAIAYQNSPALRAARAELLAVNEQLDQAQSGLKPTVTANTDVTYTDTETEGQSFITSDGGNTSKSASLNVEQPIFRGGSTIADIRQAKNTISAQQLLLSETEQSYLYDTAVAYMNVLQSRAILALNNNNRDLIARELERAEDGFKVGELTRTDVSQSEARLADAKAKIIRAEADLRSAIAVYTEKVGIVPPGDIAYPETQLFLPQTLEEALSYAGSNNRNVLQAKFTNAAAEDQIDSIQGELLPQLSAQGSLSKVYDQSDFIDEQEQTSVGLSASIPLYQAGATRSRIREAKKRANQRYMQILEAQNRAKQETISHWQNLKAADAEIRARQTQIEAARIASEGVHYEVEFGERTILDALNASQELLDARVNLIIAKRNKVVAEFALARTLGLLVPQKLGFSTINP